MYVSRVFNFERSCKKTAMYFAFFPPCILCSLRQCECLCVGGRGVWSKAGQSQQEGPDLDMVVKFHWLTGGSLHWLLSVELIIHMVGGREWKPPQKKKKKHQRRGHRRGGKEAARLAVETFSSSESSIQSSSLQSCLLSIWVMSAPGNTSGKIYARYLIPVCFYWSRRA